MAEIRWKFPNSSKNLNRLKLVKINRVEGRKRIHGFKASLPEFLGKGRRDLQELTIRISFNKNTKQRGGTESEWEGRMNSIKVRGGDVHPRRVRFNSIRPEIN